MNSLLTGGAGTDRAAVCGKEEPSCAASADRSGA